MPASHLVRFETSDQDQVLTQLRAYKERELDRSPPSGFRSARLLRGTDGRTVSLYTEWDDAGTADDTRTSAPWEACMDLCSVFSDTQEEASFEIEE